VIPFSGAETGGKCSGRHRAGAHERGATRRLRSPHQQAIQRIQRDMDQQADAHQPGYARHHQRAVYRDGRRGVQRVEADAAAPRRVDGVGQQVVDIDQPAQQQQAPGASEADGLQPVPIDQPCDQRRNGGVQQQVQEGAQGHAGWSISA